MQKFVEDLQIDLKNLASETRRKFPQIKDSAENNVKILKNIASSAPDTRNALIDASTELVRPLLLGCNTKVNKVVLLSLATLQKLVNHGLLNEETAAAVVGTLWSLMETGVEELKLLQTTILLITTNSVVKDKHLAKALVLCFRLHFAKNSATINTAAATIRQCASAIFERVVREDEAQKGDILSSESSTDPAIAKSEPSGDDIQMVKRNLNEENGELTDALRLGNVDSLKPSARDAYMLFQDLCLLVNGEPPLWLQGLTEMTRTLGLEILESILVSYATTFKEHKEFTYLLKERVCPLVIKLFSPSLKFKQGLMSAPTPAEKPSFPMVCRLIRLITIIIKNYFYLLNTECEIFLSLLIRFLDTEKPRWQRALALEVLYKSVSEPHLIKHITESYDMKEHSTKIFKEVVNSLSSLVQSTFISQTATSNPNPAKDAQGVPPAMLGGLPVGPGVSPHSGFSYRGNWIPLHPNVKIIFYDMLDKTDPPAPPDGYCLTLGYLAIVEMIRCLQVIFDASEPPSSQECRVELINASWCGSLAALSILLDTSTDETATENILRSQQIIVSLCGSLGMTTPRDAFVTSLCKAALPANYALAVLSNTATANLKGHPSQDDSCIVIEQSQVVAVGSGLPVMGQSSVMGPIMLTYKNIQCMRSILSVAHCHGAILGSSWHLVLTTLQHLMWILGLKFTGKSNGPSSEVATSATPSSATLRQAGSGGAVITTAVMADLPVLTNMLSRLFESSQYLDEVALHHLIDALCKLSSEAMEIAFNNKEPSLFPVAKLMETGQVNIQRIEIWWKPVYAHLLEVCHHSHAGLRQSAADALLSLIKEAISYKFNPPFWKNTRINNLVLHPLSELSEVPHGDVCQKQLDCVQHILHTCGDQVADAWLRIIRIVGSINESFSEQLIRNAFQCLQLIITDYLSVLNEDECYPECVKVAAKFADQKQDLNIALTAVGSIWHITDYFFQQATNLKTTLSVEKFDQLWICVHTSLANLCVDDRPAVRKSSGQTLFNTIDTHGSLLQKNTWTMVLWKVLFPLLESVEEHCAQAPEERQEHGNILMHHSRDTAAKQWAETHVMTLAGVAHVFTSKQHVILKLDDFLRAWKFLLERIEASALSTNSEISVNALRSLQELLTMGEGVENSSLLTPAQWDDVWAMVWQTWVKIGLHSTAITSRDADSVVSPNNKQEMGLAKDVRNGNKIPGKQSMTAIPQQTFLALLLQLFPPLMDHISSRFCLTDLHNLCTILAQSLAVPAQGPNGEPILPMLLPSTYQDTGLTPLQTAALKNLKLIKKEVISGSSNLTQMIATFFTHLLGFLGFAVHSAKHTQGDKIGGIHLTFVTFGERCMELTVEMYRECADNSLVVKAAILEQILKALHDPLSLKYNCPSQTTWKLANQSLVAILLTGIPVAKKHKSDSETMWNVLANTLQDFLFTNQKCLPGLSLTEFQQHEQMDCNLIELIRDQFLSSSDGIPDSFIERMIELLNAGSIHSSSPTSLTDLESSRSFREELAQLCFQTLLEYSFSRTGSESRGTVTKAAVKAILQRCKDVLAKYVEDERLSGKCPLPRARLSEVGFVLKAMSTLLSAFKSAPKGKIDAITWQHVIDLYPQLVDCVSLSGGQFMKPLRIVLHEYADLLQPQNH